MITKRIKKVVGIALFTAMMVPTLSSFSTPEVNNQNPSDLVDVCFTRFNSADGTIRSQRTIQLRRARAERVVAFYNENPSAVVDFELGACE